ncbi:MAG: aspartyl-phosphate phosphatase Spo0E family protein [Alkalicoccus sp.]|nr:MAG: aspartyl-phosphate phosphatase Spo0E family protein [Alkalicoccus sp.]
MINNYYKEEIEEQRHRMIFLAQKYGLSSPETIKCSQELDRMMNTYFSCPLVSGKNMTQ